MTDSAAEGGSIMAAQQRVQRLPTPPDRPRVETGAVQFGNDWPGLFVRGDNAFSLAWRIRRLADLLAGHPDSNVAVALRELTDYADLIEQDVIVR